MNSLDAKANAVGYGGGEVAVLSDSRYVHLCGNALRFAPCPTDDELASSNEEELRWCEGADVGVITTCREQGIIAYAERHKSLEDPRIFVHHVKENAVVAVLSCHGELGICALALCRHSHRLVAIGDIPDHNIMLWDWRKKCKLSSISAKMSRAVNVSFDPANTNVFASTGTTLQLWEIEENDEVVSCYVGDLHKEDRDIVHHCWGAEGTLFLASDGGEILHVSARTGGRVGGRSWARVADCGIASLAVTMKHLLVCCVDGQMIWLSNDSYEVAMSMKCSQGAISSISFTSDYHRLVAGTTQGSIVTYKIPPALLSDSEEEVEEEQTCSELEPSLGSVLFMRAFASMPVLCVVGSRGLFSVWLAPAMRLLSSVRFDCNLSIVALSEEAKVAALGSEDGQVMVLDMSDVKAPRTVFSCPAHSSRVLGLSFPSPSLLLSASSDGSVVFFSISRGSVSLLRRLQMEEVLSVDMYQQTHLFVSTKSRRLFILPVPEHGEEEQEQEAVTRGGQEEQEGAVLPAAMISFKVIASSQPNAGRLVGWLADRSLRSFTFTLLPLSLREMSSCKDFSSPGTSLAVSEDGEVLLAGGADGRLYLKTLASLEGGLQRSRHRRLLWRLPSGRGAGRERGERKAGVSCLELGNGAMRGWFFSGGHDSAIIAQPLNSRSSKPLDFVPSSSPGLLALLPSLEENDAQEGEEAAAEGAGSADPVLEKRKSSIRRRRAEEGGVIREQLEDLKEKFDMILSNNRTCPEEERLNRTDIIVDVKERQRLLDMADAMVANVRQEISRVNDAKEEEALQIKSLCFDAMEVTQLVVVPLGKGSERLYSFPLKKQTEEELKAFERVTMMRKIEMRENELRAPHNLPCDVPSNDLVLSMSQFKDHLAARGQKLRGGETDEKQDGEGGEEQEEQEEDKEVTDLLYNAMDLTLRERKLNQIVLLRQIIRRIKTRFNQKVDDLIKFKSNQIDKIDEKNARLLEIAEEIGVEEDILKLDLADSERAGESLKVKDSEIQAEKYLSAAEKAAREKQKEEEEARKAASAKDDGVARALQEMMYGTLEVPKKEKEIQIEKPSFYDFPPDTLTDEQVKLIKEYDKQVQLMEEEKEKLRKTLEAEAKKIRGEIQGVIDAFNHRLTSHIEFRRQHNSRILEVELEVSLLLDSIVKEEDYKMHFDRLTRKVDTTYLDYTGSTSAMKEFRRELEQFREEYETLLNEDKSVEKTFKKEFVDSPFVDELTKLFKKRKQQEAEAEGRALTLDPFAGKETGREGARPEPMSMDELPDGLSREQGERFLELRGSKMELEMAVKSNAKKLLAMNQHMSELKMLQAEAFQHYENAKEALKTLQDEHLMDVFNLYMLVKLKQGQVELDGESMHDAGNDAAMIEREATERLNSLIKTLGQEKISLMIETKDFRKKIHLLDWTNQSLQFQAEEVAENTRYFQLVWVTKELQSVIKGGVDHLKSAEIATLEKQLEHNKHLHDVKVQEMKQRLFRAHKQIREKELENSKLLEYVQDLAVSVAQREKIMKVRQSEAESLDDKEYKMQEVIWRRLVLEEARQQSEDIAVLKAEVDRLRQRTFPSFAKSYAMQNARR